MGETWFPSVSGCVLESCEEVEHVCPMATTIEPQRFSHRLRKGVCRVIE